MSRLNNLYQNKSLTRREFNHFVIMKKNIKMISLFEITRLKDFFEYQTWQKEMKNQFNFMNLWHYVEIENVESIDLISDTIVSISIVSVILEKLRKIKINNLKAVTIMKNRLKCNDKNLLKDEVNAKNAWKILKTRSAHENQKCQTICWLNFKSSFSSTIKTSRITFDDSKWKCKTFEKWLLTC
jgi:uncharacterized protein YajQ (UPF0234 family)